MSSPFILTLAAVVALAGWWVPSASAWTFYTNEAGFTNALTEANFTENFDSLPSGNTFPSPTNFTGNGLSFDAVTTTNGVNPSLYGMEIGGNHYLSVVAYEDSIVFTNFTPGISAFGGIFFAGDEAGDRVSKDLSFTVHLADSSVLMTNVLSSSTTNFYGFVCDADIRSVSVGADASFPMADRVTVGLGLSATNTVIAVWEGKLIYSFVAGTNQLKGVTTTDLLLTNSWTTNNVTAFPPLEVESGLMYYRFETPMTNDTKRFMRVLPQP